MATRRVLFAASLLVLGWLGIGRLAGPPDPVAPPAAAGNSSSASAELSADIVDGHIAAQLFIAADLSYRLDIQFTPAENASLSAATRPSVSFAMQDEHMDGVVPPLQQVSNGKWRATGQLPKRGKWIINVGVGDDLAEAAFDTK